MASLLSPTEGTILFAGKISPRFHRKAIASRCHTACKRRPCLATRCTTIWFSPHIRNQTPDPKKFTDDLTRFGLSPETLTKSIAELSGGEKQRVSLIRNLQFLPKALLLDEITSALDDANKRNVNDIIHRYAREQNIAVLWVTHDSNEITHADDVITLRPQGGKMEEAHRG